MEDKLVNPSEVYMTSYDKLRKLRPCRAGWRNFIRYMGGVDAVKRLGAFSVVVILAHDYDHCVWVLDRRAQYTARDKLRWLWYYCCKDMDDVDSKIAYVERRLSIGYTREIHLLDGMRVI